MALISQINDEFPAAETEDKILLKSLYITVKMNYVLIYEPPFSSWKSAFTQEW